MTVTGKLQLAVLLAGGLTLGGCACLRSASDLAVRDFVGAPHLGSHHLGYHHMSRAARPAAAVSPESELAKCNRGLYVEAPTSPEALRALEDKCRAVIVEQKL